MTKEEEISVRSVHDDEVVFELGRTKWVEFQGFITGMEDCSLRVEILDNSSSGGFKSHYSYVNLANGKFLCSFPVLFPSSVGSITPQILYSYLYIDVVPEPVGGVQKPNEQFAQCPITLKCIGIEEKKEEEKKQLIDRQKSALKEIRDNYDVIAEAKRTIAEQQAIIDDAEEKINKKMKAIQNDFEKQALEHHGLGSAEKEADEDDSNSSA